MPDPANINHIESPAKLRFGILCNGYHIKKWQVKAIDNIRESGTAELCLLIINNSTPEKSGIAKKLLSIFNRDFLYRLYTRFISKPDSVKENDMSEKLSGITSIKCSVIKKGKYSEIFPEDDVLYIKEQKLDFILRFGFNIIRGEILKSAKFGVWSYHHGDEEKYRGGPPGFWEIFYKDSANGVILQQLSNKLDSGIVLKKAFFKTIDHSYCGNVDNLFNGAAYMPAQVCQDILNNKADYFCNSQSTSTANVYRNPNNFAMIKFSGIVFLNKIRFHYSELFHSENWNIGIIKKTIAEAVSEGITEKNVIWMPKQKPVNFRADSFAYADSEGLNILFEDYDYRIRKGKISKTVFREGIGFSEYSTILEKEHHLAYPYILGYDNDTYLIPESFENRRVDLYKTDNASGAPAFYKTLLNDIDAVDSTVFYYNDKWWLFCTKNSDNSNSKLFLFFADKLDGNYIPHPANPIKTDVRSARPAGKPFLSNNILYRPAQDSSVTYGGRIAINKILKLNPCEFIEETVGYIGPLKNAFYNSGIHTICEAGDYVVFDAKRFTFAGAAFRYHFVRKIRKVFKLN